jgi:hypothetical protein
MGGTTIRTALADGSPALYDTFILMLVTVVLASPIRSRTSFLNGKAVVQISASLFLSRLSFWLFINLVF